MKHVALYVAYHIDRLMQKRRNSIANAMKLRLFRINPSVWNIWNLLNLHLNKIALYKQNYAGCSCFMCFV